MAQRFQTDNTEKAVDDLTNNIKEIPLSMRGFSLGMRSLYAEKQVSSQTSKGKEFNNLRDDTKRDALVYINGILPISTTLVRSISEFFEYYEELDMEEWKENLAEIIQEVEGYKQCCKEVAHLHEDILVSLKKRQDQAKKLMIQFKSLEEEYKRKKDELEGKASSKRKWAVGLCFIPGVNAIAAPLLFRGAEKDIAESVASGFQCELTGAAALVISDILVPSLQSFINGIEGIAGFFSVIEQELKTFQSKGEKSKERAVKLHYTMMRRKAATINQSCKAFFAMIPSVRSDFSALPDTPSDQNYVDEWLARKKEEISRKYRNGITTQVRKMISYFSRYEAMGMITQYTYEETTHVGPQGEVSTEIHSSQLVNACKGQTEKI